MSKHRQAGTSPYHLFLLVIMGVTWGLQFTMLKLAASRGFGEVEILTVSLAIIGLGFLAIIGFQKNLFRPKRSHILYFAVGSFFGYILPLGMAIHVSQHLPAGLLVLMGSFSPVLTISLATLFRTEQVSLLRVVAMLLGTSAAIVIFWPGIMAIESALLYWMAIGLVIPCAYAIDGIYIGAFWPDELGSLQVVAGESITAAAMMFPFFLVWGDVSLLTSAWTSGTWAVLIFTLCGFVEVVLFFLSCPPCRRGLGVFRQSFGALCWHRMGHTDLL